MLLLEPFVNKILTIEYIIVRFETPKKSLYLYKILLIKL